MFALNTNYDFSIVDEHIDLLYIYDGNLQKDITTAGFIAENYTIVHNAPDSSKDAIGMFVESFRVSDITRSTYAMHYYDSVLVIEKRKMKDPCVLSTGNDSF